MVRQSRNVEDKRNLDSPNSEVGGKVIDVSSYFRHHRPEMMAFVPENPARILEIGCGEGSFAARLGEGRDCETWGIELVPEIAKRARKKLNKVLTGRVEDNIKNLPDGAFDAIICNDVLEHLAWPDEVLKGL